MPETCASDTGPILHLAEIDSVVCLKCLDSIVISPQVKVELRQHRVHEAALKSLNDRIRVERVTLSEIRAQMNRLRGHTLHTADLSVAALAERLKPDVVLTDDLQLRKALESRGNKVVGSVGIVLRAFTDGIISKDELQIAVDRLFDGSSLYMSRAFREHVYEVLDSMD